MDQNGKITKYELLKRFTLLDKNHDGVVNRDEFVDALQQSDRRTEDRPGLPLRPHHGHWGRPDRGGPGPFGPRSTSEIFERLDKNHDGSISKSEVPDRVWEHFLSKADADHNDVVTKEELESHRKNLRENRSAGDKKPASGESAPSAKPEGDKPPEVKKEEDKPQANRLDSDLPADATAVVNAA